MKRLLKLAAQLLLKLEAATETFGFLGKKGGGKTYGAQKLFELLFAKRVQCIVFDPVGNWWNLRIDADGKSPGLPVYVFGGPHGDVPLESTAGAYIAQVVVKRGISVVLDVSRFRKNERKRFMADFAEEFFHLKKDNASPVHLFIEEAHVFVPQRPQKGEERMLGAMEDIVRIGRNYGIGCSLISQRAASVNKDVLTQVECLLAFQTSSAQDRRALKDWIEENDADGLKLLAELSKLQKGEALFWSPSFMRTFLKAHIAPKATFDGSATPKVGEKRRKPKHLAPVDLVKIHEAMKETIERAEENNAAVLKERIKKLQLQLQQRPMAPAPKPVVEARVKEVRTVVKVPLINPKQLKIFASAVDKLDQSRDRLAQAQQVVVSEGGNLRTMVNQLQKQLSAPPPVKLGPVPAEVARAKALCAPRTVSKEGVVLKKGAVNMLRYLATWPDEGLSRRQLATLAHIKTSGSTFSTYSSMLRSAGMIEERDDRFFASEKGLALVAQSVPAQPRTTEEMLAYWEPHVKRGAMNMLRLVVARHPEPQSRMELARDAEIKDDGSTLSTYVSTLKTLGLVNEDEGITAGEWAIRN